MNRRSLVATLDSNCREHYNEGQLTEKVTIKYLPIFERPDDQGRIGITENGYWCTVYNSNVREIKGPDHNRYFFALLETNLNDIINLIKNGLKDKGLPEIAIITFPFDEILVASFQTSWSDIAWKWIDQGYPLSEEMRLILCNKDKQSNSWIKYQRERLSNVLGV